MKLALVVAAMGMCLGRQAMADTDPLVACHAASPTTKMTATFRADTSLADLALWVVGFTCKNVIFSTDVAKHATRVTILAPNAMTPKQALQLFVDAVEATGLVVVQKGDTITIKLGAGMPKTCPDVTTAVADPLPPATPDIDAELDAGIKAIDATHVTVTRALLDKVLADPTGYSKSARVVPALDHGKPSGFKLYAIRPSSVIARLGFHNGDTLRTINGFDLTSADAALDAYTKLRDATSIAIDITREGKPLTIHLKIQ